MMGMKRPLTIAGAVSLIAAIVIGVAGWVVYERIAGTVTAGTKPCHDMADVTDFDVLVYMDAGTSRLKMAFEVSDKVYRVVVTQDIDGTKTDERAESIFDGDETSYTRIGSGEWTSKKGNVMERLLPTSMEDSLCLDLEGAEHEGKETLDNKETDKYAYVDDADGKRDWDLWVDSDGWVVRAESLHFKDTDGEVTVVYVFSELDKENTITIPTVGQ